MNAFNRAMTILLFVTLMIVVPIGLIFPDAVIGFVQQFLATGLLGLNTFHRVILILLGMITFIICGLVLYLEVRRNWPSSP